MSNVNVNNVTYISGRAAGGLKQPNGTVLLNDTLQTGGFLKISGSFIVSSAAAGTSTITVSSSSERLSLTSAFLVKQTDVAHIYMAMVGQNLSLTSSWLDMGAY